MAKRRRQTKHYVPPTLIFYGQLKSITGGFACTGISTKSWDGVEDDVSTYGFLGTPQCKD